MLCRWGSVLMMKQRYKIVRSNPTRSGRFYGKLFPVILSNPSKGYSFAQIICQGRYLSCAEGVNNMRLDNLKLVVGTCFWCRIKGFSVPSKGTSFVLDIVDDFKCDCLVHGRSV